MNEYKWTRCLSLLSVVAIGCADDSITTDDEIGATETDSTGDGDGDSSESAEDTTTEDTTTEDTTAEDTTAEDTTTEDTTTEDTTDTDTTDTDTTEGGGDCQDGAINQDETDIDCGGLTCGGCADGGMCLVPTDCVSTNCADGICAPLGCQSDDECNDLDGPCNAGSCDMLTGECVQVPANEALDCDTGDLCLINGLCTAGECLAEPVDCSALDDVCSLGACDPMDGSCVAAPANEGEACDDGEACTLDEVCSAGACMDPENPDGFLLAETFAADAPGWTVDTNWSFGPALAGCGDPAADHTPTDDNRIAGVVIGGCAPTAPVDAALFYCLTSPVLDTSALPTVFVNYWRDLWSDYTPYMKNKIEVWNGLAWVIVYETFGSPGVDDAAWTNFSYDLTAHKNAAMQVRWCYNIGNAGAFARGSWNVDDVTIGQVSCTATP
jgi:hypothetical protein